MKKKTIYLTLLIVAFLAVTATVIIVVANLNPGSVPSNNPVSDKKDTEQIVDDILTQVYGNRDENGDLDADSLNQVEQSFNNAIASAESAKDDEKVLDLKLAKADYYMYNKQLQKAISMLAEMYNETNDPVAKFSIGIKLFDASNMLGDKSSAKRVLADIDKNLYDKIDTERQNLIGALLRDYGVDSPHKAAPEVE